MTVRRLALVTDAWHPQTNGVVSTLSRLVTHLRSEGVEVRVLFAGEQHLTLAMPSYPEIRLACDPWKIVDRLREFAPDAIHVATEGPLGMWATTWLRRQGLHFTTSFHTRFPEYLNARYPVPLEFSYSIERWFHGRADQTLVGTRSMIRTLQAKRVGRKLVYWPRGVDAQRFNPRHRSDAVYSVPRPIWIYVGRIAAEKSLEDFLSLDLPGTKVVVGDGPARESLQRAYPNAVWCGYRYGDNLAAHFASADCFVFPSRTETFGNVLLEALASGLPVAAAPAPGAIDLVSNDVNGAIDEDLRAACMRAVVCSREVARRSVETYTPEASHAMFRAALVPMRRRQLPALAPAHAATLGP